MRCFSPCPYRRPSAFPSASSPCDGMRPSTGGHGSLRALPNFHGETQPGAALCACGARGHGIVPPKFPLSPSPHSRSLLSLIAPRLLLRFVRPPALGSERGAAGRRGWRHARHRWHRHYFHPDLAAGGPNPPALAPDLPPPAGDGARQRRPGRMTTIERGRECGGASPPSVNRRSLSATPRAACRPPPHPAPARWTATSCGEERGRSTTNGGRREREGVEEADGSGEAGSGEAR